MSNWDTVAMPTAKDFLFKGGDVRIAITVAGQVMHGMVSSHALAMASPVWNKFVFPPFARLPAEDEDGFKEVKSRTQKAKDKDKRAVEELDFKEDDVDTLLILFRIVHLQFGDIPVSLTLDALHQVAVLCDMYDCAGLVQPWLGQWLSDGERAASNTSGDKWVFITWALGNKLVFEKSTSRIVREISVNNEGQAFGLTGELLSEKMPSNVLDNILEIRQKSIQKLLDIPYHELGRYRNGSIVCARRSGNCNALQYGESLIMQLEKLQLYPVKEGNQVHISVDSLATKIKSISTPYLPANLYGSHTYCGKHNVDDEVGKVVNNISCPTLDVHRQKLEKRR
ncbi:hypothetical protein LSUE1_G001356 [Lachnellula suecica]|uniref:Uncharacterized protein n=1 Tax=Lachnellula suecica TaxID=602035 RepID=A0A8T9CEP8_9HELO|nr:hypothetical protein LSUE1_G001356 [Lachnellula suecica]